MCAQSVIRQSKCNYYTATCTLGHLNNPLSVKEANFRDRAKGIPKKTGTGFRVVFSLVPGLR